MINRKLKMGMVGGGRGILFASQISNADDGVHGMAFVRTAVESSKNGAVWTGFPEV